LREWAADLMNESGLSADGIFDVEAIRSLWTEFLSGNDRAFYFIWNVLMFQAWYRRWSGASTAQAGTRHAASFVN
jgi:asparagine synthase (glutamine-hydrolysing)